MTVQLALRKHDARITAKAIQWWTGSIYSHCELVVDGGYCYSSSAMDGGVRGKVINLDPEKWDVVELPWADAEKVLQYFNETDPLKYGWLSLIASQMFNTGREIGEAPFCSQWCAAALGLPNAVTYSPETLLSICVYLNQFGNAASQR